MKLFVFILSGLLVFFGSKFFPDFLTAVFFLIMLISGALLFTDQRRRNERQLYCNQWYCGSHKVMYQCDFDANNNRRISYCYGCKKYGYPLDTWG